MKKPKYEKPLTKDLSSMQITHGSCASGPGEQTLTPCEPGAVAVSPCTVGELVYPRDVCADGGFAGASCFNGSDAG